MVLKELAAEGIEEAKEEAAKKLEEAKVAAADLKEKAEKVSVTARLEPAEACFL